MGKESISQLNTAPSTRNLIKDSQTLVNINIYEWVHQGHRDT